MNEICYEKEQRRKDGKIIVTQKELFNFLMNGYVNSLDQQTGQYGMKQSHPKRSSKLRQKPAHEIEEDVFDQKYFKDQRDLILDTYSAIRTIRLIFANHPKVRKASIDIPDCLREEKYGIFRKGCTTGKESLLKVQHTTA